MTDKSLVERLRYLGDRAAFEPHMYHTAADRIEHLESEMAFAMMTGHDLAKSEYREMLNGQEARIEQLERDKRWIIEERDRTFALMLSRAENAEAEARKEGLITLAALGEAHDAYEAQLKAEAEREEAIVYARHIAQHGDMVTDDLHDTQARLATAVAALRAARVWMNCVDFIDGNEEFARDIAMIDATLTDVVDAIVSLRDTSEGA